MPTLDKKALSERDVCSKFITPALVSAKWDLYADTLDVPFVFSSNGDAFVFHDRTGQSNPVELELAIDAFPSPAELWRRYCLWKSLTAAQVSVVEQDYHPASLDKQPRYYQQIAINRAIEAIIKGQERVLLVMSTGTGKTYVASQIIWRLWKAGAKKRIIFPPLRSATLKSSYIEMAE